MKTQWFKDIDKKYRKLLLVGDVGGTNTNLGVAGEFNGKIDLILEVIFESATVTHFTSCVKKTMEVAREKYPNVSFDLCCISGAGPVKDNFCKLTNQNWVIDGNEIQRDLGVKTLIINDFSAISFGLPLLDVEDPKQIEVLKRADGTSPEAQGDLRCVAGAGTGLGVGFLAKMGDRWRAFPSEGGHMDFADFDEDTRGFKNWIQDSIDLVPEYEMAVSGMGIKNLFYYFLEKEILRKDDPVVVAILREADVNKPAAISKASSAHEGCLRIMKTFVKIYARFASSVASFLIPKGGFYLAGGISGKNLEVFTKDNLFVSTFELHCNPNIRRVLQEIPIYVVKDYSISLYGAANAALSLMV
ncbi:MAG TPA: glucokinase [Spirochaetia bacterium]|nr:glucokinase [Spirochaetia bacterium]